MAEDEDEGDALFLDQLLGTAPMTEERGFQGSGEYSMCPVCGSGLLYRGPMAAHEELLRQHLASHPIEDILRAINLLQKEARAGRLLRAKVQAALE